MIVLWLATTWASIQDPKPHPGVDQKRVDAAVDRGAAWLLKQKYDGWDYGEGRTCRYDDLVLYTLLHAGVDRQNALFQQLLKNMPAGKLEVTYCVAFQAMALAKLDPVKYQRRIAECAQFFVDTQCANGQWSYGKAVPKDEATSGGGKGADVSTGSGGRKEIQIKRRLKPYLTSGDNSNSQYAALGLRACMEACVFPPVDTFAQAKKWWEEQQNRDGGWCYGGAGSGESYGSMTAGATASLILYKHYLKEDWKESPSVAKGIRWISENFTVTENARIKGGHAWFYYYALYAVERVGVLGGISKFGGKDWYALGAEEILKNQSKDGWWLEGNTSGGAIKDTCFAILFLRRATVPLPSIASGSKR